MSPETEQATTPAHHLREFDIPVPIKLNGQDIEDILVTAFEGGIGHWCRRASARKGTLLKNGDPNEPNSVFFARALLTEGDIRLRTDDDGKWYMLTLDSLVKAVQRWVLLRVGQGDKYHRVQIDPDTGRLDLVNFDAEDADVVVQYAVFNDYVYG